MNINDPKQPYEVYDEIQITHPQELFDENYDKTPNPKTPLWQDFVLIILAFAGLGFSCYHDDNNHIHRHGRPRSWSISD